MLKKILFPASAVIFLLGVVGLLSFGNFSTGRVAYVQNELVFQEFRGKKELEMQLMKFKSDQKNLLDSLSIQILSARKEYANSKKEEDLQKLKETENNFIRLTQEFEKVNEEREEEFLNQIWKQLNQYVQDYGKENGYDFIYGATGNGNIMYASEKNNITNQVVEYINLKYEGR